MNEGKPQGFGAFAFEREENASQIGFEWIEDKRELDLENFVGKSDKNDELEMHNWEMTGK